jgi:hypothetical protein
LRHRRQIVLDFDVHIGYCFPQLLAEGPSMSRNGDDALQVILVRNGFPFNPR